MGRSQDLSEFQRGTVIGHNLCNKSSCEIFSLSHYVFYSQLSVVL